MTYLLGALLLYLVVGYLIAWQIHPISRREQPLGAQMWFTTSTWAVLLAANSIYKRTGKWPRWYPAP